MTKKNINQKLPAGKPMKNRRSDSKRTSTAKAQTLLRKEVRKVKYSISV